MKRRFVKPTDVSRETFFTRTILIIAAFAVLTFAFALRHSVYNVYINEKIVASVEDTDVFYEAREQAEKVLSLQLDGRIPQLETNLRKCFSITKKNTADVRTLTALLLNEFEKAQISGYNIYIDGKYTATGSDERTIRRAIEKTEQMYIKLNDFLGGDKCEGIAENIRIESCKTLVGNVSNEEKLLKIFGFDSLEKQYEQVLSAEFFSEEIFMSELALSARERENTSSSDVENIIVPTIFSYEKSHEETLIEDVPFGVEKVYTAELAKGSVELCKEGVPGKKNVNYTVYTTDGIETSRRKNSEVQISEPENCVMLVGTYEKNIGDGFPENYGKFLLPCDGVKSSGYGMRNLFGQTNLHKGCDIAAPCGTDIVCAAAGVVEYAGENGNGYGIHAVVDHGNGFTTLYAHMRECFVKTGDEVLMGQKIGEVGLTGNTTGFHLHFEILKNGVAIDPENYIRIG